MLENLDKPNRLIDFVGQDRIKTDLALRIQKAKSGGGLFPHLMLSAPPEMGKSTLAQAVAAECGVLCRVHSAEHINQSNRGDFIGLTGVLANVRFGEIIVIADVDAITGPVRDQLTHAITNFRVDITVGNGTDSRTHSLPIPQFTFVGLASRLVRVERSLSRWCVMCGFDRYTASEIGNILVKIGSSKNVSVSPEAAYELAAHCDESPGYAAVIIERINRQCGKTWVGLEDVPNILRELGYGDQFPKSLKLQDSLTGMGGQDFEYWAAEFFRGEGYTTQMTKTSGDHGLDLILMKDGVKSAVQCKRWTDSVGEPVLRDFYGAMVSAQLPSGIVMTTSTFTASAMAFAQGKPIRLIDIEELLKAI